MIKKVISEYGDVALGIAAAGALIPLLWWTLTQGPLYDFITRFIS